LQANAISKNGNGILVTLLEATRTVFVKWPYLAIATAITSVFWILFSLSDELLFFSPIISFYLPKDAMVDFVISTVSSILLGMVISMSVYAFKHHHHSDIKNGNNKDNKNNNRMSTTTASLFSGSSLSLFSAVCTSCSTILPSILLSIFGTTAGATIDMFLSNYHTPLRIMSVAILIWSYYSVSKIIFLSTEKRCQIVNDDGNNKYDK
jgi:hypothetical protein